jgi:D-alanyl-D-alanine carboxypeptidase
MLRSFRASLILAASFAMAAFPASAAPRREAFATPVIAAAQRMVAEGRTAGLSIQVRRGDQVLLDRSFGYANLETRTPAGPGTVYRIASATKQFTAAAVLRLSEQGKLSLDDKLTRFFPDFPGGDAVTVRSLLNHTSGIHNFTEPTATTPLDSAWLRDDHTSDDMVARIRQAQPLYDFPPGTQWRYNNSDYYLAGVIVEKVSGQPLGQFLHEQFFQRLGMRSTRFDNATDVIAGRASGYVPNPGRPGAFVNAYIVSMTIPGGAGALLSTTNDLATWEGALVSGKVLGQAALREMTQPARLKDGRPTSSIYGLGLRLVDAQGHRRIGHEGEIFGFNSFVAAYPDQDLVVAVIANTNNDAVNVAAELADVAARSAARGGVAKRKP